VKNRLFALIAAKELRDGRRLDIKEIVDATKISRDTLNSYLRQEPTRFDGKILEGLCRYFQVGVDQLIYFDPPIDGTPQQSEAQS